MNGKCGGSVNSSAVWFHANKQWSHHCWIYSTMLMLNILRACRCSMNWFRCTVETASWSSFLSIWLSLSLKSFISRICCYKSAMVLRHASLAIMPCIHFKMGDCFFLKLSSVIKRFSDFPHLSRTYQATSLQNLVMVKRQTWAHSCMWHQSDHVHVIIRPWPRKFLSRGSSCMESLFHQWYLS